MRHSLAAFLFCICGNAALAQTTVPYTFTAGATAKALEVSGIFSALATEIDNLSARVSKLEGQITAADLVGIYSVASLGVMTNLGPNNSGSLMHVSANGTLALNADGTLSFSGNDNGFGLVWGPSSVSGQSTAESVNDSGTWSLTGNTLTLSFSQRAQNFIFAVTAGGRLFVSSHIDPVDRLNDLILIVRTN